VVPLPIFVKIVSRSVLKVKAKKMRAIASIAMARLGYQIRQSWHAEKLFYAARRCLFPTCRQAGHRQQCIAAVPTQPAI
jgi:hypothetical protein